MKSRNLKAIFAALSAVAVMATAMTGFAAATTTYDSANNKVIVSETVTADANSEVTYLVKSNEQIVYIDQTTANESGSATFNYKIDADKIVDLETAATFGTDGVNAVAGGSATLDLAEFGDIDAEMYTVTFAKAITGNADKANATIAAKDGYEITDVKINDVSQGVVSTVELGINDVLAVEAKKAYTAPIISAEKQENVKEVVDGVEYDAIVTVIAFTGDAKSVGVICKNTYYKALATNADGKAAVKLILPEGAENVTVTAACE